MRTRLFIILLLTLIFLLVSDSDFNSAYAQQGNFDCANITEIPPNECEALAILYRSTNGMNWIKNDGWLVTGTPCSWYGVTCELGHVRVLNLSENNLRGNVPLELSNLVRLRELDLSINTRMNAPPNTGDYLSGSIPPELGRLNELERINFRWTDLSGNIPSELGQLTRLKYLNLDETDVNGNIPPGLGNLANLEYLNLSHSFIGGTIPPEISNLTNLEYLILNSNSLRGTIPSELSRLTKLKVLGLGGTRLSGNIPPELGQLSQLESLNFFYSTDLTGNIPPELGNLTNLKVLDFHCTSVSGNIPPELGNLTKLKQLYLSCDHEKRSQLTGPLPQTLVNLKELEELRFYGNDLCSPANEIFQNWLKSIAFVSGNKVCISPIDLPQTGDDFSDFSTSLILLGTLSLLIGIWIKKNYQILAIFHLMKWNQEVGG